MSNTHVVPKQQPLLSVQQVATELQISGQTVRRLIEAGDIAAVRIGRQYRVEPSEVARFRCAPVTG